MPVRRVAIGWISLLPALACATAVDTTPAGTPWHSTLSYDGAWVANLDGGRRPGSTYLGVLRWRGSLDLAQAWGWHDSEAFVEALWLHGGNPDQRIGDVQGVNNLSGTPALQLEEAWLQHNVLQQRLSLLGGLYNLNSEFYVLPAAGLFLNSSFGIGPEFAQSGQEGPSIYPRTALGLRVDYKPKANVVLRGALLDGVPVKRPGGGLGAFERGDGLLWVGELALLERPAADPKGDVRLRIGRNGSEPSAQGKLALGAWHYSASFPRLQGDGRQRGASGYYLLAQQNLLGSRQRPASQLSGFVQLGWGDPAVQRIGGYRGAGLVWNAPLAARPQDELGLAVAQSRNGLPYRRLSAVPLRLGRSETSWELSYLAQLGALALQPDLQYVVHPGGDQRVDNAWVFTLRFELATDL